jgi:hydroxymethylglutaryl-CoA reductase
LQSIHYTKEVDEELIFAGGNSDLLQLKGNVENPIGLAKIPIGVVGPILIHGHHVDGYVICPFATTEGALVASATRGAALLTRAGGVHVRTTDQVMIRAPAFFMTNAGEAELLLTWILANFNGLQEQIKLYSQHSQLLEIKPQHFGRSIVLLFKFKTSDAAGQNMVTVGTWHACKWAVETFQKENPNVKIRKFLIESLISGDKKIAFGNLTSTRGLHVIAEAWISESVIKDTLKTTVEDLLLTYQLMQHGANRIGSVGFNSNISNVLASIFTATGQDVACVGESSSVDFIIEPLSYHSHTGPADTGSVFSSLVEHDTEKGIYACLVLPSLVIGTVGGGTALPTQMECLEMMGCYGSGKVSRFGEIIASVALGLELSTLGALANGTFALSHERLGRNAPQLGLNDSHIDDDFFVPVLKSHGKLIEWKYFDIDTGNSIISDLTKSEMKKKVGHFGYMLKYQVEESNEERFIPVVMKSKPLDTEACNMINKMAQDAGFALARLHDSHKMDNGFRNCHIREVNLAAMDDEILRNLTPKIYHTLLNTQKDIFLIIMEHLNESSFSHLETVHNISEWSDSDIKVVLRDLAKLHGHFYHKKEWLYSVPWLEEFDLEKMKMLQPLFHLLLQHANSEFPQFWTQSKVELLSTAINNIPQLWSSYSSAPKTLVHNDCNPRNICIRRAAQDGYVNTATMPYSDPRTTCLYDWELARIDLPQHDVVEFLSFTLPVTADVNMRLGYVDFYRKHFEYFAGISYPPERLVKLLHGIPTGRYVTPLNVCFHITDRLVYIISIVTANYF